MHLKKIEKKDATEDQASFLETEFASRIYEAGGLFYADERGFLYPGLQYQYITKSGVELSITIAFQTQSGESPISIHDSCVVMLEIPQESIFARTTSVVSLKKMMTTLNTYIVFATISTLLAENGKIGLLSRIEKEMIDDLLDDDLSNVDPDDLRTQVWKAYK